MRQQQTQTLPQPDYGQAGDKEKSAHEQNRMIGAGLCVWGPGTRRFPGKFAPGQGAWLEVERLEGVNGG